MDDQELIDTDVADGMQKNSRPEIQINNRFKKEVK